jgi:hypothetical protein
MKVKDLNGKLHNLDVRQTQNKLKDELAAKSKFQYEAGQIIKKKFGMEIILEEVKVPGHDLYIDFLLPNKRIAFEIQGRQHGEYVQHFHKSPEGFKQSIKRDTDKKRWCEINGINLYYVHSIQGLLESLGLSNV